MLKKKLKTKFFDLLREVISKSEYLDKLFNLKANELYRFISYTVINGIGYFDNNKIVRIAFNFRFKALLLSKL